MTASRMRVGVDTCHGRPGETEANAANGTPRGDPRRSKAAPNGTSLCWSGCAASVALLSYAAVYGRNVPYFEDWVLVPVLSGSEPFTLSWLFEMTVAEHRFILAKALLYPMWLASGGDFRVSMVSSALVSSVLALACIAVARRLRGRASFATPSFLGPSEHRSRREHTLLRRSLFRRSGRVADGDHDPHRPRPIAGTRWLRRVVGHLPGVCP